MGQQPRAGGRYITPIDSNGAPLTNEGPRGTFTLTAGQHYYYILGGAVAPYVSVHLSGDAAIIITSALVQDCDHDGRDVTDQSNTAGDWVTEDPSTAFAGADGTGWAFSTSLGITAAGSGVGGGLIHVVATGAYRTRVDVLVGATGGKLRVSAHGKD